MDGFLISPQTRGQFAPTAGLLNISMDFNAAPSGTARGTEVIIPDDASPATRAAAQRFNARVAEFARKNGIADYPVRGVKTRSENGRGVPHTVHVEPFFNSDLAMQQAIKANPAEFAEIYRDAFGSLPNARLIAPHGIGKDRGAASEVFGNETNFGELMANTLLGGAYELPEFTPAASPSPAPQRGQTVMAGGAATDTLEAPMLAPQPQQRGLLFDKLPEKAQDFLSPERVARLQMALEGMTLNPNQGVMMAAQETIKGAADGKRRNKTAEWLAKNGRPDLAEGVASGAIDGRSAIQAAMAQPDSTANLKVINGQLVDISTGQVVGDYRDPEKPATTDDIKEYNAAKAEGYEGTLQDWIIGQRKAGASSVTVGGGAKPLGTQGDVLIEDKDAPGGVRVIQAEGSKAAREAAQAEQSSTSSAAQADQSLALIDSILTSPDLGAVTGMIQGRLPPRTQAQQDLLVKIQQLQGKAFLSAFETLKGGGQITEREGQAAQNAMARLQRVQSDGEYVKALNELREIFAVAAGRERGRAPNGSGLDFSDMDAAALGQVDVMSLSDAEMDAFEARMKELGY